MRSIVIPVIRKEQFALLRMSAGITGVAMVPGGGRFQLVGCFFNRGIIFTVYDVVVFLVRSVSFFVPQLHQMPIKIYVSLIVHIRDIA